MRNHVKFDSIIIILAVIMALQFGCQTKNGEETNSCTSPLAHAAGPNGRLCADWPGEALLWS